MAITASLVGSPLADNVDRTSYTFPSWTPTPDRLVKVDVYFSVGSGTAVSPTLSGNGITWSLVDEEIVGTTVGLATYVGKTGASPSTGALTISFSGVTQAHCCAHVTEIDGADLSGTALDAVVQSKSTNDGSVTSFSSTLTSAPAATSRCFSAFGISVNEAVTHRTNWTELADAGHTAPTRRLESQWRSDAAEQTFSASWTSSANLRVIAVEIKAAAVIVTGAQATETDTGNTGSPATAATGTQTTETDTANGGSSSVVAAGVQASTADSAFAGTPLVVATGSQADETDTANAGVADTTTAGSQASESDTTNPGAAVVSATGTPADETDTAQPGVAMVVVPGSQATETDTANAGQAESGGAVEGTKATEADTANSGTAAVVVAGSLAAEVDSVFAGVGVSRWPGLQATETDSAFGGAISVAVAGNRATETDTANSRQVRDANPRRVTYTEPSFAVVHQDPMVTYQDTADLVYQEG